MKSNINISERPDIKDPSKINIINKSSYAVSFDGKELGYNESLQIVLIDNETITISDKRFIDIVLDETFIGRLTKMIVNWLSNLFKIKWQSFEYEGNPIRCNKSKDELIASLQYGSEQGATVFYNNGQMKFFAPVMWHSLGDGVCRNCFNIKVVIK